MDNSDLWVFGYGSLMWQPGFVYAETIPARLHGYRRSLCIYSYVYRGNPDFPGLVLGLNQGGSCEGLAFRVTGDQRQKVIDYLREREQVNNVYLEKWLQLQLSDGRLVQALVYIADSAHDQYAGNLPIAEIAAIVKKARGMAGDNTDYVLNTLRHLREMAITDDELEAVSKGLSDVV